MLRDDKTLLIATRNVKKQKELHELLADAGWTVVTLREFPDCPEVVEDGLTFLENAQKKAVITSTYTGLITLADDSGLAVDALNGAPGVYSARYARGEDSTDEENLQKVLLEMKDVPEGNRTARFVCAAVLADGEKVLLSNQQYVEGHLIFEARGTGGFGYDPIFFYPPFGKTFAQVPIEDKHSVSHRGKALNEVVNYLRKKN